MHKFHMFMGGVLGGGREGGSQNIKEMIGSLDSGVTKNCLIT